MATNLRTIWVLVQFLLQRLAFGLILVAAVGLVVATGMSALGQLPWVSFSVQFGEVTYDNAGMIAQISVTVLVVMLAFYLPSNARIMALETSHRRFSIGMQDVARAYALAHAADRAGTFQLSSEFDAVRERLAYLRDHPDLGSLEPALLEIAAQMSHISRELAEVYSDDKIARARGFLKQRQQEVESFNARLDQAKAISQEMKHWLHEVELDESVAASQLARLKDEMKEIMPEMGIEEVFRNEHQVVEMLPKAAE